jgi:hypothetical protein
VRFALGLTGMAFAAVVAVAALPAEAAAPVQAPACLVPQSECGTVQVPLFRSDPAGPAIGIAYVLGAGPLSDTRRTSEKPKRPDPQRPRDRAMELGELEPQPSHRAARPRR